MIFNEFFTRLKFGSRQPILDGVCEVKELGESLKIIRDENGIPYIQAKSEKDAWFGLGFCQAQDRLFQIEITKRQARGSLSEVFGKSTIPADRFARQIGFYRIAKEYLPCLSHGNLSILTSFTQGINAGIMQGHKKEPLEFAILKCAPTLFEPADVIAIQLLLTLSLSHWIAKLTRYQILKTDGMETVAKLDPEYASWNYLISPVGRRAGKEIGALISDLKLIQEIYNKYGISNNWAISPKLSASGFPVVGNDPHLAAELPAPWYLAGMKSKDFHLCGACFPGSPFFLAGFNGFLSWGITAAFTDNLDLYLEKYDKKDKTVIRNGKKVTCKEIIEEIVVKDDGVQKEKVIITDHGPLISPLFKTEMPEISMRATWFTPKAINGFFTSHHTKDIKEFKGCFKEWPLMAMNLVFADTDGNIGWQIVGEIPLRKRTHGLLPMPAWDGSFDWVKNDVRFSQKSSLMNPQLGFIVTANNKPIQGKEKIYLGRDYIDGYRHARQINLLMNKKKIGWEQLKEIQLDQFSQPWSEIKEKILEIKTGSEKVKKALDILKEWDGIVQADSPAATIFEFFVSEMVKRITAKAARRSVAWVDETFLISVGSSNFGLSRISQVIQLINEQPKGWFTDGWKKEIETALLDAITRMEEKFGVSVENWKWGEVRKLKMGHILLNLVPELNRSFGKLFNLEPVESGGDEQTVNVAAGDVSNPLVKPNFIANLRMMVEVGNWQNNYFCLAGGQSGNPFSDHYSDLFNLWVHGKGIAIKWDQRSIEGNKRHELVLERT
jgi:penicillin G amidase